VVEPWEEEIIRRRESECQESLTATAEIWSKVAPRTSLFVFGHSITVGTPHPHRSDRPLRLPLHSSSSSALPFTAARFLPHPESR
jgi:hypothetical protein